MGNQKQKWTEDEENALKEGVAKHGPGKWKLILVDPEFASKFVNRSNVDLKDKWRNMGVSLGYGSRDNSATTKAKATTSRAAEPKNENNSSFTDFKDNATEDPPQSPQAVQNVPQYNEMILEAISSLKDPNGSDIGAIMGYIEQMYGVPQNFRRLLSSKLRKLVFQDKLEKVLKGYKIKDAPSGSKTPPPEQKDVRPRPLQHSSFAIPQEMLIDVAERAAQLVARAEYEDSMTAEGVEEWEQCTRMADEAEAMLAFSEECHQQCTQGELLLIA